MGKKLLIWTIKDIREVIEKSTSPETKFDFPIAIEGNRGLGKSTLGYKILSGLKIEKPFNPKKDLVYTRDDTLKHLASKINGAILSDEMINVAYRRDFYQEGQKDLLKAFDMYRDSRNVFIGCIPKFIDLDNKIQKIFKLRLDVKRRGMAVVHMPLRTTFTNDPWDVKNNQKIESKWAISGTKNPRYSQLTTCVGILYFGDLTENQRAEYDRIKFEKRNHVFKDYEDQTMMNDPEELFMRKLMKELKSGKITPKSFDLLCSVNGKNIETMRRKINNQLKDEGDEKRWKDYCLSEKKKKRKDQLGFNLSKKGKKTEEQKEEKSLKDTDKHTHTHKEEGQISLEQTSQNTEDIFGFETPQG